MSSLLCNPAATGIFELRWRMVLSSGQTKNEKLKGENFQFLLFSFQFVPKVPMINQAPTRPADLAFRKIIFHKTLDNRF